MDKRGLVVGKFYPPHRGHKFLIETARAQVEHLTVLICSKPEQSIPGARRAAWLREIHPDVEVVLIDDTLGDDNSQGWAEHTLNVLGYVPDVVFTSEDYGDAYARFLGCRHVLVDRARVTVPVSGTVVRADPLAYWNSLEPCVRAYFVKRIAIVGAESTGSTTLAGALAEQYNTLWVPEYGREYCEQKMLGLSAQEWQSAEFVQIAQRQCEWEEAAARQAQGLLFCDTPAFATSLWHERYLGQLSPEVEQIALSGHLYWPYALTLVTDTDIPFVQDGTRDGEHIRHAMHARFLQWLTARGVSFTVLSGPVSRRMQTASALIDTLRRA